MEKDQMTPGFKVVVIGGSAGSLDVLLKILPHISTMPSFALVIVVHRKSGDDVTLEELIALKAQIPVKEVEDKVLLVPGSIYIAPSDYHLLFEKNGLLSLDISEKVNYSRPSIDVTFESAAEVYGSRLAGILLSGANSDGTNGLKMIKESGGTTVIQNPETVEMDYMPRNALQHMRPTHILDTEGILAFLTLMNA